MPNIPDSRAPATVRFQLPDENIGAVTSGLSKLSQAVHEKDKKKKEEEKARKQEPATADVDPAESPQDESPIEDVKSDLRDASEYMQEKLRDIDLYEEMSEFASGLYQGIREQLGFTDSSPSKIDEQIRTSYADMKTDLMARQSFKNENDAAVFSQRFDEKARFDQQSLGAFKQQVLREKIYTTVDRHIEKYGAGVIGNPDTLTDAIIVIDSNINDLAPGIGREAAVEKSKEARRSLLSFALQGRAKQGNYDALQSLLDGVDSATGAAINIDEYVNREDKGYFQSIASKGIIHNEATKLLDDVSAAELSEEDLLRTLEHYPDQLVGKEAGLLWKSQQRLQAKEQRERIKGQRYSAWNYLVENRGNIDVNNLSLDLSEADRDQIAEYADKINAGDNGFPSDVEFKRQQGSRALYEINGLQVADPEAFQNYDLSHYFKDLSPKQISQVMAMQQSEPDPRSSADFKLRERLAQRAQKNITGSDGQGEFDRDAFVDFRVRLDERIDEYNGTHNEPAGPFEVEQIVNDMVANGEVVFPNLENEVIWDEEGRDVLIGEGGESLSKENSNEDQDNSETPIIDMAYEQGHEEKGAVKNNLIDGTPLSGVISEALATNLRLDRLSSENQEAVDMHYNVYYVEAPWFKAAPVSEQNREISELVDNLGILPSSVQQRTIDDINSGDPDLILRASDLNARLENLEIDVPLDIADFERSRLRMISTMIVAGVAPKDAVERTNILVDPTNKKLIQIRTKEYEEINKPPIPIEGFPSPEFGITGFGYLADFPKPLLAQVPSYLRGQLEDELNGLHKREYLLTGNWPQARKYAKGEMVKNWGGSQVNGSAEFMKHPPEMYYGHNAIDITADGSFVPHKRSTFTQNSDGKWIVRKKSMEEEYAAERIENQLQQDLMEMGIPKDIDVFLVADGRTDDEAQSNLRPSYKIQFSDLKQSLKFSLEDYRWNPRDGFFAIK